MKHLIFCTALVAAGGAVAGELKPVDAASLTLGEVTGVTYFTKEADGYQVVTTLAAGERGLPVRFIATLQPGQRAVVSVPREVGQPAIEVEIARIGDTVQVNRGRKLSSLD